MFIPVVYDTIDESVVTVGTVNSESSCTRFFERFVEHCKSANLPISDFRAFVVRDHTSVPLSEKIENSLYFEDFDLSCFAPSCCDVEVN